MNPEAVSPYTIVLDLDDTLFKEVKYQTSGILHVADLIKSLYGVDLATALLQRATQGKELWTYACEEIGVPCTVADSFLWSYRLHTPDIQLDNDVSDVLRDLYSQHGKLFIITDGRSVTQRLKLHSLGLTSISALISEEHDSTKPEPLRFEKVMNASVSANYVYIGDNPKKDFLAPNKLGWLTIGLKDNGDNIHSVENDNLDLHHSPRIWVNKLTEVAKHLC